MNKKIMWLLIGAVVFYFVWKKFIKKSGGETVKVEPVVANPEAQTQGDLVNETSF